MATVRHPLSITKLVRFVQMLAKESSVVSAPGFHSAITRPDHVVISSLFFRKDICKQCGWCCRRVFTLDYLTNDNILAQTQRTVPVPLRIRINGKTRTMKDFNYSYIQKSPAVCDYLTSPVGCKIHGKHPLSCRLELIKVISDSKGTSRLTKQGYGRGWMKDCTGVKASCEFGPFDRTQFEQRDLPAVIELQKIADKLEIQTWLPEIIEQLRGVKGVPEGRITII
jgi:hypothetical protein